ncbi:MAG: uncharacterized protein JWQ99_3790 [Blastococcus sp.]|nr:uncharacterized protein [Blastococcus sp.]
MSRRRKVLAALSFAVLAVAAVLAGLFVTGRFPGAEASSGSGASSPAPTSAVRSDAPAPAEATGRTDEAGASDSEPVGDGTDPESGQTLATDPPVVVKSADAPVSVTFYGWQAADRQLVVGGYVGGVVESDGTCTLTLTKGGAKVTERVSASPDAASTACGAVAVPGSRLAAGTWQAVLSYASGAHTGTAAAVAIEVTP